MRKYRFDNAYEKIYKLQGKAYIYIGSYYMYGITKSMTYEEAKKIIERSSKND